MSTVPFLGEIMIVSYGFPPKGWALCNGQFLAINQNQALFSLLGTTYGGNGLTTFALPDLRGRRAYHRGQGFELSNLALGEAFGTETVTLTEAQVPSHTHSVEAVRGASMTTLPTTSPTSNAWSNEVLGSPQNTPYTAEPANVGMAAASLDTAGGSQPHDNLPPYLVLNFVIALVGTFPTPAPPP